MKKLLLATLTTLSIITAPASAGERTPQMGTEYNPNNYIGEDALNPKYDGIVFFSRR